MGKKITVTIEEEKTKKSQGKKKKTYG